MKATLGRIVLYHYAGVDTPAVVNATWPDGPPNRVGLAVFFPHGVRTDIVASEDRGEVPEQGTWHWPPMVS